MRRDAPRGVPVLAKLTPGSAPLDVARPGGQRRAPTPSSSATGCPAWSSTRTPCDPRSVRRPGRLSGPAVLPSRPVSVADVHEALPACLWSASAASARAPTPGAAARRRDRRRCRHRAARTTRPRRHRITAELAALLARHDLTAPPTPSGSGTATPQGSDPHDLRQPTRLTPSTTAAGSASASTRTPAARCLGADRLGVRAGEVRSRPPSRRSPARSPWSSRSRPSSSGTAPRGIAVLEQVIAGCRELGALVLLDVKRGDIGTTAQAYADAYLHPAARSPSTPSPSPPTSGWGRSTR